LIACKLFTDWFAGDNDDKQATKTDKQATKTDRIDEDGQSHRSPSIDQSHRSPANCSLIGLRAMIGLGHRDQRVARSHHALKPSQVEKPSCFLLDDRMIAIMLSIG
jgi:hypothetical protein